ncbi:MAG: DNA-binding protein [Sandaracinaceae bacterium]|nr:DNA-binding protein [Sandaracinaceae bacterium]MDW8246470.1 sigma factor-like helix-turn-helix DNA-binding protein [Sandaracinaceae bacterium]
MAEHLEDESTPSQSSESPQSAGIPSATSLAQELAEIPEPASPKPRKRRERPRGKTISIRRLSKKELARGRELYPETDYWRPKTRADCLKMERPCPFVSCKYHLYLDVHPVRGAIKINFTDIEVWEMAETCALDVADRGGITLEEVGEIMNLTRERVRQVETAGLAKLAALRDVLRLKDYIL